MPRAASLTGRSGCGGPPVPPSDCVWLPLKKAPQAAEAARRQAQQGGHQVSQETLAAADWVILVTPLPPDNFAAKPKFFPRPLQSPCPYRHLPGMIRLKIHSG